MGSSVLCASVAAKLDPPPNPASTIKITASHKRTQTLFCFKAIPHPPICVSQRFDDRYPDEKQNSDQTRPTPGEREIVLRHSLRGNYRRHHAHNFKFSTRLRHPVNRARLSNCL